MQIEALESRELLSVSPMTDFQDLATMYSSFPISEQSNFIDVTDLTVENLRAAIEQASQTVENDVIVVHTTQTAKTIRLDGSALIFDVNSDLYGSITLVGYGDSALTISNMQENVAIVNSGDVYFGGISFLALEPTGQSFKTDNLVVVSEDANVIYERSMFAVEDALAVEGALVVEDASSAANIGISNDSSSAPMATGVVSTHTYTIEVNISGTQWAFVAGLSLEDYNKLKTWTYNGTIKGNFIDAEKDYYHNYDNDGLLCWAAAASNILWYTEWANPNLKDDNGNTLFNNEDDVFQYFTNYFTNDGSSTFYACDWFLTGHYNVPDSWSQLKKLGGGAFYPTVNINNVTSSNSMNSFSDVDVIQKLREDYGVAVSIYIPSIEGSGHAVTAWGYVYDTSYAGTASYYKGLIISDSDNDKYERSQSKAGANAINTLTCVHLAYDYSLGQYQLIDYSSSGDYALRTLYPLASYRSVFPVVQLSPPTLNVNPTGSDTIAVNIGSVTNASGYVLEYSTNPNFTNTAIRNVDENSRTFTLSGLDPYTTYYFRVKAKGGWDYSDSEYSAVKSATTSKITLATPTLSVVETGADSVFVSIGSVANASGYLLEYSTNPSFSNAKTMNVQETYRDFSISELKTNTTYYFRVKAIGSGIRSDSKYSNTQTATPRIVKLASPSLSVTVIPNSSSVYVTVGNVENASGYALEYSTDSKFTNSTITSVPSGTSTIGGLASNTQYYFRVVATGTGIYVNSDYSKTVTVTTDKIKLLTPRLSVSALDSESISVTISNVIYATGYTLEYSTDSSFANSTTMLVFDGTSTVNGLYPNTTYYFRVMATGTKDYINSNISTTKSATTYAIKLDVPALHVSAINADAISVTIDSVENASGYKLEYSTDSKFTNTTTEIVQAGDIVITGLSAKTMYYFRISAIGTGCYANSDYSPMKSARTYATMVIDNVGDSISTAKEITFTNDYFTFTDSVGSGEYRLKDVDIYKLTVSSSDVGKNYTFTTFQPAGGTRVDTVLRLFDSSGNQLEFTDDAENDYWYSSLIWSPTAAGTYYLGVSSYLTKDYDPAIAGSASISGDQGDYTLTITRAEAVIKLDAPTISVSANDSNSVVITVSNVENASEYSLQYATNSNFTDATSANIQVGTNTIAGLTANTQYYFRVMALGLGNYSNSDYSATKSIKTSSAVVKLDAPTLSFNGNVYSDSISITVGTVANASGYSLQYSTDSNFTNATSAPIQAGANTITGLIANTTYYFRVMALGEEEYSNSDYSEPKSITTNENSAIDKVGDSLTSAKDVSFTDNTFAFTNSLGEGEYGLKDVDIYKLVVSDSDVGGKYTFTTSQPAGGTRVDTFIRLFNSSGAQLSYNDDGGAAPYSSLTWSPTSAGVYYLGVSSYLNKGYDPAIAGSASTNGTKGDYTLTVTRAEKSVKLAAPTLNVNTIGSDSVSVTVGSVTNASEYTLQYSTNSRFTNAVSKSVSAGTTNITGLNENTLYYFRVLASGADRFDNSDYSVSQIAKTNQSAKLDIAINDNRVTLSWNDGNLEADAVRYRIAGTTRWTTSKLKAGVTTYTFSGAYGANYEIEVLLDQQENSVLSGSAVVLEQAKLSAVKNEIKDDAFQVNVTNYAAKNLSSNAHQAIVTINGVKTTLDIVNQQGTKNISGGGKISFSNGLFTFTEMKSNTSYKVQISFSDSVSISKVSSTLTVKTAKARYQTPNLVSATADSDTSITVAWQTAYGKNSNTAAQKYTIQYSTDGVKWSNATTAATGNSYTIQRLKGGVEYQVRVLATKDNAFDASAPSAVLTAETLTLPKIALEKNSVKDDTFQLNITNYQTTNLPKATTVNVKSDKFGSTTINLINGSGSGSFANGMTVLFNNGALTFANVPSNTQQKIQLNFSKGVCTTAWSSALSVKTLAAPYNKPVLTNAVAVASTSIEVSWDTVYGKNSTSPAQKYTVQYSTDGVKWTNATTGAMGTNFTITRLKANTKYLVAVIANKDSKFNASEPSDSLLITTLN